MNTLKHVREVNENNLHMVIMYQTIGFLNSKHPNYAEFLADNYTVNESGKGYCYLKSKN